MTITRRTSALLKGISILLIILHNLTHWLPNAIKENEYNFNIINIEEYKNILQLGDINSIFLNFFSHYGHYGICIFLFISGYGLVKKYENKNELISSLGFIWEQAIKLWRLMIPGFIIFIISEFYLYGEFVHNPIWIFTMFGFITNLHPNPGLFQGPWWYFSLTMQAYIVYLIFNILDKYRTDKSLIVLWSITIISLIFQYVVYESNYNLNFMGVSKPLIEYVRYNILGHLLPFVCGITFARKENFIKLPTSFSLIIISLIGFVLLIFASCNIILWLVSPIFVIITIISISFILEKGKYISNCFIWIGGISSFIFVVHPIVRTYFFDIINISEYSIQKNYIQLYGLILLYIIISVFISLILNILDSKLFNLLYRSSKK